MVPCQGGFTLVELSVVLVIIALIVGGITSGQALVKQAELRSIITDVATYKTAINAFKLKYGSLPADLRNATVYWGGVTANGNGNGAWDGGEEQLDSWQQLSLSGLLPGNYIGDLVGGVPIPGQTVPESKIKGKGYWLDFPCSPSAPCLIFGRTGNVIMYGVPFGGTVSGSALSPSDARAIDIKVDDSVASSGEVIGKNGNNNDITTGNCTDSTTIPDYAAAHGSAHYILLNQSVACKMYFWTEWQG